MTQSPATGSRTNDPTLDQDMALRVAARRLAEEFDAIADEAVIEGMLNAAYHHLVADATLDNFLPLLAERFTREWLRAAAGDRRVSATR
ncbi:three-helix bundle dimerization domain-containing protein [Nocardia sp. NPDC051832]|uniref:three-helix bundle dimerization domain-containing protein n=1 Tax=Nocardia sp. NPDC051832 TaxID=3155673 RepID=UPI00343784C3